jgi:hypothetical protein
MLEKTRMLKLRYFLCLFKLFRDLTNLLKIHGDPLENLGDRWEDLGDPWEGLGGHEYKKI